VRGRESKIGKEMVRERESKRMGEKGKERVRQRERER
jgi:hypothetical protein